MPSRALLELLRGKGAHADPVACVEDLSLSVAQQKVPGFPHSIGQLVFHMNYWMDYELRRIRGEQPAYPEHSSQSFPPSTSPATAPEWGSFQKSFAELIDQYCLLANSSSEEMRREINTGHPVNLASLEAVLWQMVAHNSYHIGQIAVIRQMLGVWPPRGGGDSW